MERLVIVSPDELRAIGDNNLEIYEGDAQVSGVPESFYWVSQRILDDLDEKSTPNDAAHLLFGFRFFSDDEAESAIIYAQTVSLVKESKSGDPSVDTEQIDLAVGWATIREQERGEEFEKAKQKVEDHFEDPRSVLNFSYLEQILDNPAA